MLALASLARLQEWCASATYCTVSVVWSTGIQILVATVASITETTAAIRSVKTIAKLTV